MKILLTDRLFISSCTQRPRSTPVRTSVKHISPQQTEAAQMEAFLVQEGFQPVASQRKRELQQAGIIGMPPE
jgi:hypothetical protein